jgi:hypothetical protein
MAANSNRKGGIGRLEGIREIQYPNVKRDVPLIIVFQHHHIVQHLVQFRLARSV